MPFDFDNFVNQPSMAIFGRQVIYRPKNPKYAPFEITGDFHTSYKNVDMKAASTDISSAQTVLFVRLIDFPTEYPNPLQGDYVSVCDNDYQIINIEHHIPGSKKLVLHECHTQEQRLEKRLPNT